jgi:hypothetical protein
MLVHPLVIKCGWKIPALNGGSFDWIGLMENLQETIDFPIKHGAFLQIFP